MKLYNLLMNLLQMLELPSTKRTLQMQTKHDIQILLQPVPHIQLWLHCILSRYKMESMKKQHSNGYGCLLNFCQDDDLLE